MVAGVPAHVDGRMLGITEAAGARVINPDRMWHYIEGVRNWDPIWAEPRHPDPARARRRCGSTRPAAAARAVLPGLRHPRHAGPPAHDRLRLLWFVLTQKIIEKEFALSGSEQNPDLTGKDVRLLLSRVGRAPGPVEAFKEHGADFVVADDLAELVGGMNGVGEPLIDGRPTLRARDRRRATARSTTSSPRTPRSPRSAAPATTAATS